MDPQNLRISKLDPQSPFDYMRLFLNKIFRKILIIVPFFESFIPT